MEKSLAVRIISILSYIIFGFSILFGLLFFINKNENLLLVWAYTLFGVGLGLTLIFTIANMFKTKKAALNSLIVLGIFAVLVLVSYLISSNTMPHFNGMEEFKLTPVVLKWIDTAMHVVEILIGVSFIGLIYTEIRAAFR